MVRPRKLVVPVLLLLLVLPACAQGDITVKQLVTITVTALGESRNYRHEETQYVQEPRQRREQRELNVVDLPAPGTAEILDCQSWLSYQVDFNTRKFVERNVRPTVSKESLDKFSQQREEWAKKRYSIQTIDTGQRKPMLGLMARHIITSIHGMTAEDSSEATIDAWYVDLPEPGCAPEYLRRTELFVDFLTAGLQSKAVYTGFVPPGLAAEVTVTTRSRFVQKELHREIVIVEHRTVTELSREKLDPALFSVPAGFEKVDRLPRSATSPRPVLRKR